MTLEKAIRDLQARVDGQLYIKGIDTCKDIKIGIEALKEIRRHRRPTNLAIIGLLPGESEE